MRHMTRLLLLGLLALIITACTPADSPTPTGTAVALAATGTSTNPVDTATPLSPTQTHTPVPPCPPAAPPIPGWPVYCNDTYGFYIQYPPDATLTETDINSARIDLPIAPDTNLGEKYLELILQESSTACTSPLAEGYPPERVEHENLFINGINFLKQSGSDAGVGNIWDWIAYSTGRGRLCVHFDFVLHSTNPFNYPTPPPEFDPDAETADFEQIAGSLKWYTP